MAAIVLISTAYLPPAGYFSLIKDSEAVLIEKEESYLKQSYRNRCYVLSANGPHLLTVPVFLGSSHKTALKDVRIDYSKRWQQVHLRAISTAYRSSPFFQYYSDGIERDIMKNHEFLLDLNASLTETMLKILGIKKPVTYTTSFTPAGDGENDFRYRISPKKASPFTHREYPQVFDTGRGFVEGLSIIDLVFNMGPDAVHFL